MIREMNQFSNHIKQALSILDFQFNQDNYSSVYLVSDLENISNLDPKILLDLDRAKLFEADAVYFRFFYTNRLPQPQIYIYDNTIRVKEPDYYAKIHRNIWSASEIPIFIVLENTSIKIYDSREPAEFKNNKLCSKPVVNIDLNNLPEFKEVIRLYNAKQFDSGSFWEGSESESHFLNHRTAYERLIAGLKSVRESFRKQSNLSPELSDQVLILSVLVKYLEENGIDENGTNLAQKFFFEATGYSSFTEIIRNNKLIPFFDKLAEHFNGNIFELTGSQRDKLQTTGLDILAFFLDGTITDNNQLVLWAEYSFKHIPVELISNFYEEFLPKETKAGKETKVDTGAVYTPGFLVNFLVDESLPLTINDLNEQIKLIDVSCGSGIFLVTAFKRLVQRWRIANKKNGKLADTNPAILKNILNNNIYGIDIDRNAVELTIFSLNLSLCSMLTPKQIWTELRFDDLKANGNITHQDFFKYLVENKLNNFDLVIGNPPFIGLNEKKYKEYVQLLQNNNLSFECKIPDNQLALMFLDKTMNLLKSGGLLCLILPSGPLLYNNTLTFRSYFFQKYNIPQVIDFTFLRNTLFVQANVAVAALFVQKKLPDTADILHIGIKRTKANKEKNYFEIDHYDFHNVPKQVSISSDFVWKSNLVGGGRVYNLIDRFHNPKVKTLRKFLTQKIDENHWEYGQGYKVGNKKNEDIDHIIFGRPTVIDKFFKEKGIEKIEIQKETHYETIPISKMIFEPPHLLVKKTIGKKSIPFELRNDYLTFRNEIIGIHCPETDLSELERIERYLSDNNDLFRFIIAVTSSRSGISRSIYTNLAKDFHDLPYFEDEFAASFTEDILIDDIIKYIIPSFELGENSKISTTIADNHQIKEFSKVYCKVLNSIYGEKDKEYGLSKIYEGDAFIACEYNLLNNISTPPHLKSEWDFSNLIDNWSSRNALIKRVLRIYGKSEIILIKPKQLRYWLKSIALRDADETLNEAFDFNL